MLEITLKVDFNGKRYPGQTQEIIGRTGEVFCSMLHKSGKNWKWPEKPDIERYKPNEIVHKINAPVPASARGLFSFLIAINVTIFSNACTYMQCTTYSCKVMS